MIKTGSGEKKTGYEGAFFCFDTLDGEEHVAKKIFYEKYRRNNRKTDSLF